MNHFNQQDPLSREQFPATVKITRGEYRGQSFTFDWAEETIAEAEQSGEGLSFATVVAFYENKLVLVRTESGAWEFLIGSREAGESLRECAQRACYERAAISLIGLKPFCVYTLRQAEHSLRGLAYVGLVADLAAPFPLKGPPAELLRLFPGPPKNLHYGDVDDLLYNHANTILNNPPDLELDDDHDPQGGENY